jgi:hypothetical protein
MKKLYYTLFLALSCSSSFAQAPQLTVLNGSYTELQNPISLSKGIIWDDPEFVIKEDFNFSFYGVRWDSIIVEDYGITYIPYHVEDSLTVLQFITPLGADLIDRADIYAELEGAPGGESSISYEISGTTPGNRILTIEWKNVGFYNEAENNRSTTNYSNFQLRLFEIDNSIEMHYGPSFIDQPVWFSETFPGPSLDLVPKYISSLSKEDIEGEAYELLGSPTSPTVSTFTSFDDISSLSNNIAEGNIYRFSFGATGLAETQKKNIILNTGAQKLQIEYAYPDNIAQIEIMDISGKILFKTLGPPKYIEVSDYNSGIYLTRFMSKNGEQTTFKWMKN